MSKMFAMTLAFLVAAAPIRAEDADPNKLKATLESALIAYNKGDTKTFYADYASSMKAIATPEAFEALYTKIAKKEFGDYKPKTLKFHKEGSTLMGDFLVVYFDAEFAEKKATVAGNFMKEDGVFKVIQVQIQNPKE